MLVEGVSLSEGRLLLIPLEMLLLQDSNELKVCCKIGKWAEIAYQSIFLLDPVLCRIAWILG